MAGHTGQSSQLFPVTPGRNAEFLATVARAPLVGKSIDLDHNHRFGEKAKFATSHCSHHEFIRVAVLSIRYQRLIVLC